MPRLLLTEIEHLMLLAILRLSNQAYAVTIRSEIEACTGVKFPRGTVYITLSRLERRGYLESWFADSTPERGGKAKRYFRVKSEAIEAVRQTRESLSRMWEGLDPVLDKG